MKRLLTMLAASLALAGCGSEDHEDLRSWMEETPRA